MPSRSIRFLVEEGHTKLALEILNKSSTKIAESIPRTTTNQRFSHYNLLVLMNFLEKDKSEMFDFSFDLIELLSQWVRTRVTWGNHLPLGFRLRISNLIVLLINRISGRQQQISLDFACQSSVKIYSGGNRSVSRLFPRALSRTPGNF